MSKPHWSRSQGLYIKAWPIVRQYRVLDCEDSYDRDDFFKINVDAGMPYQEFIRPDEAVKHRAMKRARLQAEAIVRRIETFKQIRTWRRRLIHASREFEFVWNPYEKALKKKYGWDWRWQRELKIYQEEMHKDLARREHEESSEKRIIGSIINNRVKNQEHADLAAEWCNNEAYIKHTLHWLQAMNAPALLKIFCELMDDQATIQAQVLLCEKLKEAMADGRIQGLIEMMRKAA